MANHFEIDKIFYCSTYNPKPPNQSIQYYLYFNTFNRFNLY